MKKRIIFGVAVVVLVICATALAAEFVNSSGNKTADALIFGEAGNLHGIMVVTDGTNACTLAVYDNTTNTGTLLLPSWVVTTSSTDRTQSVGFYPPVHFGIGLYVDITCAGTCNYVVYYSR